MGKKIFAKKDELSIAKESLVEIFLCFYVVGVVIFSWRHPFLTTLFLGGGILMQLYFWGEKSDFVMMIAAALLGTSSEIACVKMGVWSYHAPGLVFGIPVWIPFVWAFLFCLFRRVSISLFSIFSGKTLKRQNFFSRTVILVLGFMILAYSIVTVTLIRRSIAVVYTIFMIPAVIFWRKERDILIFIIGGTFGTLGEYICMRLGFWHYNYPLLKSIGLPLSLPLAWGLSSVIIGRIAMVWEKGRRNPVTAAGNNKA